MQIENGKVQSANVVWDWGLGIRHQDFGGWGLGDWQAFFSMGGMVCGALRVKAEAEIRKMSIRAFKGL